jgi:hypothetical protein
VPCSPDELRVFTSELLGELSRSRASVVDARTLRLSFSPVVTAARHELKRFQQQHAELVADYFGEDPEKAFSDIPDVELPDVVASLNAQRAVAAEARVAVAQTQLVAISKQAVFAEAERTELERLRANVKTTKRREASRKRSDAARPKRRRKPG